MSCIDGYSPSFNIRCERCKGKEKCKNKKFEIIKLLLHCEKKCDTCSTFIYCSLIERIVSKNNQLESLVLELENKVEKLEEYDDTDSKSINDINSLNEKIGDLDSKIDSLDSKIDDLDDDIKKANDNIDKFEEKVDILEDKINKLKNDDRK